MPRPPPLVLIRLDGMLTKIERNIYAFHNLDLPPLFKERVNFSYLLEVWYRIQGLSFLNLEITLSFATLCYTMHCFKNINVGIQFNGNEMEFDNGLWKVSLNI